MTFNSWQFLIFFPIVTAVYFLIPKRWQNLYLVGASYYFYMNWSAVYGLILLYATVVSYGSARYLEKSGGKSGNAGRKGRQATETQAGGLKRKGAGKGFFVLALVLLFSVLVYYKYGAFAVETADRVLALAGVGESLAVPDLVTPVGISFFTFQAAGYLIDVWRGDIPAEKNFIRYALFVSFFPQLLSGPIGRAGQLLPQFEKKASFDFERVRDGLIQMLWGFFLKLMIADRIAVFVDYVYGSFDSLSGKTIVTATALYSIQIYCDFYGYSMMAIGAAWVLGVRLTDNFMAPYFATSVQEFWRRWHISLTSWFRDYLYFPLGGSRKGKKRTYLNILIVFLISGLWHGAAWAFVVWGLLSGVYQIIGRQTRPWRDRMWQRLGVSRNNPLLKLLRMGITFLLMTFSWLFFRAGGLRPALAILRRIVTGWGEGATSAAFRAAGLGKRSLVVLAVSALILLIADILKAHGKRIYTWYAERPAAVRDLLLAAAVLAVVIFGVWGDAYNAAGFIYFQF